MLPRYFNGFAMRLRMRDKTATGSVTESGMAFPAVSLAVRRMPVRMIRWFEKIVQNLSKMLHERFFIYSETYM